MTRANDIPGRTPAEASPPGREAQGAEARRRPTGREGGARRRGQGGGRGEREPSRFARLLGMARGAAEAGKGDAVRAALEGGSARVGSALDGGTSRDQGRAEPGQGELAAAESRRGDAARPARREPLVPEMLAFQPIPSVLAPPPAAVAGATPPATGSAGAHAEAAALAERVVTSMRVGRNGQGRHEVRMRLSTARAAGIEVRLTHDGGRLTAVLDAEPGARADAERLAGLFERELADRGLSLDALELT